MWWFRTQIPKCTLTIGRLKQEDCVLKGNLGYRVKNCVWGELGEGGWKKRKEKKWEGRRDQKEVWYIVPFRTGHSTVLILYSFPNCESPLCQSPSPKKFCDEHRMRHLYDSSSPRRLGEHPRRQNRRMIGARDSGWLLGNRVLQTQQGTYTHELTVAVTARTRSAHGQATQNPSTGERG